MPATRHCTQNVVVLLALLTFILCLAALAQEDTGSATEVAGPSAVRAKDASPAVATEASPTEVAPADPEAPPTADAPQPDMEEGTNLSPTPAPSLDSAPAPEPSRGEPVPRDQDQSEAVTSAWRDPALRHDGCSPQHLARHRAECLRQKRAEYSLPPTGPEFDREKLRRFRDPETGLWRFEWRDDKGRWQRLWPESGYGASTWPRDRDWPREPPGWLDDEPWPWTYPHFRFRPPWLTPYAFPGFGWLADPATPLCLPSDGEFLGAIPECWCEAL